MGNEKLTSAEISQLMAAYESELRKLEFQRGTVVEAISKLQKHTPMIETAPELPKETQLPAPKKRGPKAGFKKKAAEPIETPELETAAAITKPIEEKPKGRKRKQETPAGATAEVPAAATPQPVEPTAKGKKKKTEAVESPAETPSKKKGKIKLDETGMAPQVSKKEETAKNKETESKGKPGPKASYNKWDRFIFDLIKKVGKPMTSADIIDAMKEERDTTKEQIGDTGLSQQLNRTLQKLGTKLDLLKKEPYSGKGKVYSLKDPNAKLPA
ncbi:MAG: hypothetical protein ACOYOO_10600 [Saprospiraceae bacterium]|jgi:hypothetical protein